VGRIAEEGAPLVEGGRSPAPAAGIKSTDLKHVRDEV
jgi:hypothetical protein